METQKLFSIDLKAENEKAAVIVLEGARGTGVSQQIIHVINPRTFNEYPVQDYREFIDMSLEQKKLKVSNIDGIDNIEYGSWERYDVIDNEIILTLAVYSSPDHNTAGKFILHYLYDDGEFKIYGAEYAPLTESE